jgi:hypothetical protein
MGFFSPAMQLGVYKGIEGALKNIEEQKVKEEQDARNDAKKAALIAADVEQSQLANKQEDDLIKSSIKRDVSFMNKLQGIIDNNPESFEGVEDPMEALLQSIATEKRFFHPEKSPDVFIPFSKQRLSLAGNDITAFVEGIERYKKKQALSKPAPTMETQMSFLESRTTEGRRQAVEDKLRPNLSTSEGRQAYERSLAGLPVERPETPARMFPGQKEVFQQNQRNFSEKVLATTLYGGMINIPIDKNAMGVDQLDTEKMAVSLAKKRKRTLKPNEGYTQDEVEAAEANFRRLESGYIEYRSTFTERYGTKFNEQTEQQAVKDYVDFLLILNNKPNIADLSSDLIYPDDFIKKVNQLIKQANGIDNALANVRQQKDPDINNKKDDRKTEEKKQKQIKKKSETINKEVKKETPKDEESLTLFGDPLIPKLAKEKGLEIYRKQLESLKLEGMSGAELSRRTDEFLSGDEFTFEAGGKTYKARFGKRPPNVEVINE